MAPSRPSSGQRQRTRIPEDIWFRAFLARHTKVAHGVLDSVAWSIALYCATLFRYDFDVAGDHFSGLVIVVPLAVMIQTTAGLTCGLYTGRSRFGSFDEVVSVVKTVAVTTAILSMVNPLIQPRWVPTSVPIVAGAVSLLVMLGIRYSWRLALERRLRPSGEGCRRLLIFGAGEGSLQVIPALLRDPSSAYLPVGLIDDNPVKRKLRIMGVPVLGDRTQLVEAAARSQADTLLIAMPSADSDLVSEITELAQVAGLDVKVLPPVWELFEGRVSPTDIRDVTTADLLGRHEIDTDVNAIAGYLTGKRVLVTGAGGSIGSELCQQIYRFAPERLIMLDRDESALHGIQLAIEGRALLESPDLVLVDLRDRDAVKRVLSEVNPDVIFHAAALKHLSLLERHPAEAVKTNIWATLDLLEIAAGVGVKRFVNISTDKAADPCSVLGYSKRITERLTSYFSATARGTYISVRFGNVLGSRGSMLTTFNEQIERGGPLTVTDPQVSRYFMTVEEASQLVIQAGAIGNESEVLVLDMGRPVMIAEVARMMVARSKRRISIEYTGLRPGEKLQEALLASNEIDVRPAHPSISQVMVPPLMPVMVRSIDVLASTESMVTQLSDLAAVEASGAGVSNLPGSRSSSR